MKYLFLLICFLAFVAFGTAQINYTSSPQDLQFYPRDLVTNTAQVIFEGNITMAGIDSIIIMSRRSDQLESKKSSNVDYSSGARFEINLDIEAVTKSYDIYVFLKNVTETRLIDSFKNIVAGDVFMIQGQSNAQANRYIGNADIWKDNFVRSYGNPHPNGYNDKNWYLAQGDLGFAAGSVGQWGLRLGRLLRDSLDIPIAIINGAHGGRAIEFFQRNDATHYDINTNYGRMLTRLKNAGIINNIRSIFFYQGESDGQRAEIHKSLYQELYWDWTDDINSVESFYVIQVREGCGSPSLLLREYQRKFEQYLPKSTAITVNGIKGHDGCHYAFTGYEQIAKKAYYQILKSVYNQPIKNRDIRPLRAWYSNHENSKITIETDNKNDLIIAQVGSHNDFKLNSGRSAFIDVQAQGNRIELLLNNSVVDSNITISYSGHARLNDSWILNQFGNGMFSFHQLKIDSFHDQPNFDIPSVMSGSGNAINFDGINDNIDLKINLNQSYTKEAWIFPLRGANSNNIISGSGAAFWMPIGYGYSLSAGHNNQWNQVQDPTPMIFNQWTHVAVTYDHQTKNLKLYKNGRQVAENKNVPLQQGTGLSIGGYINSNTFYGAIDEVKIWNNVRSVDEIRSQMCHKILGNEGHLIGYYRMDILAGNTINDLSGTNEGTLLNFDNSDIGKGAWSRSGAPIGTVSSYTYNAQEDLSLSLNSGEQIDLINSNLKDFVHLYWIEEKPNVIEPALDHSMIDTMQSFGVFIGDNVSDYSLDYNYNSNTFVANIPLGQKLSLLQRKNNSQPYWLVSKNVQFSMDEISLMDKSGREFVLATQEKTTHSKNSSPYMELRLSPNPSQETIIVELAGKTFDLKIIESKGHIIKEVLNVQNSTQVSIGSFPKGVYQIIVTSGSDQVRIANFVKI